MSVAGAVIGGVISAAGSFFGSKKESNSYKRARKTLELLKPEIEKAHQMMDPWSGYRDQYAGQLHRILQGEENWTADPGYQFRVAEDQRAVERAASARGSNISGNVLTELASRRQEMASQEYGNVINRLIGLAAATPENAIAGGQMYANSMTAIATGQAQSQIGSGFADSRGIAGLAAGIGSAISGMFGSGGVTAASSSVGNTAPQMIGSTPTNKFTGMSADSFSSWASGQMGGSSWAPSSGVGGGARSFSGATSSIEPIF